MMRMPRTLTPRSCARSVRNASDELPISNKETISIKIMKSFPSDFMLKWGSVCSPFVFTSFAPTTSEMTASKAGIRLSSTIKRNVLTVNKSVERCVSHTTRAAMTKPSTAPKVSAARWNPNASPRFSSSIESATSASLGAVRIPFPTRSAQRIAATAPQLLAK